MSNDRPASPAPSIKLPQLLSVVLAWNAGYKGTRVLNTLYALQLGAKPFEIGLLLATYGLFALILAVYAGRFTDRYGVRVPVIGGVIACVAGILLRGCGRRFRRSSRQRRSPAPASFSCRSACKR